MSPRPKGGTALCRPDRREGPWAGEYLAALGPFAALGMTACPVAPTEGRGRALCRPDRREGPWAGKSKQIRANPPRVAARLDSRHSRAREPYSERMAMIGSTFTARRA